MSFVVHRAPNPAEPLRPTTPPPDSSEDFASASEPHPARPMPHAQRTLGVFASLPSGQMPVARKPFAPPPPQHDQTAHGQYAQVPSVQARPPVRATAPRVMPAISTPEPRATQTTTGDYLRLAAFALAGGVIATLYVVLPLMVALHAALPFLPSGIALFALALAVVALGELGVVRVLLRTTPKPQAVEVPRRAPAFSSPIGFDVELSVADGGDGPHDFPSLGRGIPAGPDRMILRVGSARWRDHHGPIALSAYLPQHVVYAQATILHAEDAPVQGRPQCILHLRLFGMSPEDERLYRAVLA
jgi:hypothetical protein